MIRKSMLALCALTLGVASAASVHHITIINPEWVGTTQLMPGDYTVQIDGDKAIVKKGKNVVDVPAKVETMPTKFPTTSLHTRDANGKNELEEIWIGGTNQKVVLK